MPIKTPHYTTQDTTKTLMKLADDLLWKHPGGSRRLQISSLQETPLELRMIHCWKLVATVEIWHPLAGKRL